MSFSTGFQSGQIEFSNLDKERLKLMETEETRNPSLRKIMKRIAIAIIALILFLAVIAGGGYLWALSATDTSLASRGIIWGGSKFDDWLRFPSRVVNARDIPIIFAEEKTDIFNDFPIDGQPLETYLEETDTNAYIVHRDNALLYEEYFNGSSYDATQASLSVAKSFLSTSVGIAIEKGIINSLDDPITTYIPELLKKNPRFADITIRHLTMMSSGLHFERDPSNPFSDDFITTHSPKMREAALNTEIVKAPGKHYYYNDYNPLLIGITLERATGMSVSECLDTRLWGPMGAEGDGSWYLDSESCTFHRMQIERGSKKFLRGYSSIDTSGIKKTLLNPKTFNFCTLG